MNDGFTAADIGVAEVAAGIIATANEKANLFCQMVEMSQYLQSVLNGVSEHVITLNNDGALVATNRKIMQKWGILSF